MFCTQCGTRNDPNESNCTRCGSLLPLPGTSASPQVLSATPAQVPNYLTTAILTTLCCCLPAGIPAIIYASQVNPKLLAGDYAGALESSKNAKMWSWISFGLGAAIGLLYALAIGLGAVAE